MIWLCIKGALMYALMFASFGFWFWLFMPMMSHEYGTPGYLQSRSDSHTVMFGGIGLFICLIFITIVVLNYWQPWKQ